MYEEDSLIGIQFNSVKNMYNEAMERIWHPDVMRGISRSILYKENIDKNCDTTPKKIIKNKIQPTTEKKEWKKSNDKKES